MGKGGEYSLRPIACAAIRGINGGLLRAIMLSILILGSEREKRARDIQKLLVIIG